MSATFFPGQGADQAIAELHRVVGEATSRWAQIEDSLFVLFVVALSGTWQGDVRPYRAVFFTLRAYEPKMRMINAAMNQRYRDEAPILADWKVLKKRTDAAAKFRNDLSHLSAVVACTTDPNAPAVARLLEPMWKRSPSGLTQDPSSSLGLEDVRRGLGAWEGLGYGLQQFSTRLVTVPTPPSTQ